MWTDAFGMIVGVGCGRQGLMSQGGGILCGKVLSVGEEWPIGSPLGSGAPAPLYKNRTGRGCALTRLWVEGGGV